MPSRRVPPDQRKRTEISCDRCKHRKQKCHKPPPGTGTGGGGQSSAAGAAANAAGACRYCRTHGFECVTTQPRRTRIYTSAEGLGARLSLLESLVKGLVPEADTTSIEGMRALGASLGIALPTPAGRLGSESQSGAGDGNDDGAGDDEDGDVDDGDAEGEGGGSSRPRAGDGDGVQQAEEVPVLRDQQGQTQYIGPASSYLLQIRIRSLFGAGPQQNPNTAQFFLFGKNPTEQNSSTAAVAAVLAQGASPSSAGVSGVSPGSVQSPESERYPAPGGKETNCRSTTLESMVGSRAADALITVFFDHIHPELPVLHEASFREKYEQYSSQQNTGSSSSSGAPASDPTWTATLLCVFILARRAPGALGLFSHEQGQDAEEHWWQCVHALLPSVIFTSSISAVQALVLAGLHLHNNNHRDSCWTLTGAAVRIAFAIGLHRDSIVGKHQKPPHTPVIRELRKRLWWTLYTFEMLQATSLDRPSAVDDVDVTATCPRESILGHSGGGGDGCVREASKLTVFLNRASRIVRSLNSSAAAADEGLGLMSPVTALLRDLSRWREGLTNHVRLEAVDTLPPSAQRAVLLLHVQYHYVLSVLTRNGLLSLAAKATGSQAEISRRRSSVQKPTALPSPASPSTGRDREFPPCRTSVSSRRRRRSPSCSASTAWVSSTP